MRCGTRSRSFSALTDTRTTEGSVGKGVPAVEAALAVLCGMLPDLARSLGPDHELVLHDLRLIPNSIVAISGDLTGRSVGGPTTDFLLRLVYRGRHESAFRYQTSTATGRILRSSTVFIRDPDGRPVGCLCINTDITEWLNVLSLVESVTRVIPVELDGGSAVEEGASPDSPGARPQDLPSANRRGPRSRARPRKQRALRRRSTNWPCLSFIGLSRTWAFPWH